MTLHEPQHVCKPSNNPRHRGRCACGRQIVPAPILRLRDLRSEREFFENASRGICDPEPLMNHAQGRAFSLAGEYVPDPMLVREDVDQPKEVREELADGAIRLVWWLQEHVGHDAAERHFDALRHISKAYDLLRDED